MKIFPLFIMSLLIGCGDSSKQQVAPVAIEQAPVVQAVKIEKEIPVDIAAQLQFKIDNRADAPQQLPQVMFNDDNILEIAPNSGEGQSIDVEAMMKTPINSSAHILADTSKTIIWRPKWNFWGTGTLSIPSISLSFDSSILAIVEYFGSERGPYGSRIVLVNTYDWTTVAVHIFEDTKIEQMVYVSANQVYCYAEAQPVLKQKASFFRYNLKNKTSDKQQERVVSDMKLINGVGLAVKYADDNTFEMIETNNDQPFKFKTKNTKGVIALSPDKRILLYGNKTLDIFKPGISWADKSFPHDYTVITAQNLQQTNQSVFVTDSKKLILQTKEQFREIAADIRPRLFYNYDSNKLIVEKEFKSSLEFYSVPDLLLEDTVAPAPIRPKTKGTVISLNFLKHQNKYLILDSYGNLYLFYKKKRRWEKILIFTAKR